MVMVEKQPKQSTYLSFSRDVVLCFFVFFFFFFFFLLLVLSRGSLDQLSVYQRKQKRNMPCSKETLARLFLHLTTSCKLLFLFLYFSSFLFTKLFSSFYSRDEVEDEYSDEDASYYEDEEEEVPEAGTYQCSRVDGSETDDLVADIRDGKGEAHVFWPYDDPHESFYDVLSSVSSSPKPDAEQKTAEDFVPRRGCDIVDLCALQTESLQADSWAAPPKRCASRTNHKAYNHAHEGEEVIEEMNEKNFGEDDKFLIFTPRKMEQRKFNTLSDIKEDDEVFDGEAIIVGSTSKSSSEWRSSMQDSTTDDPFSSSSRRNGRKWESYTVFQKYDEEMIILDQISARKLQETESLRSFKVQPRSMSERIVYKLSTDKMRSSYVYHQNPYHDLEAAYVSQICLTWEALNCNYSNFKRKQASPQQGSDLGCPAKIAQQFQQFQVLLQRYIENEPFEYGRRPEVYARMRTMTPKLVQVPEYQDDEDEHELEETASSRISSASFKMILEDAIQTFMRFLKADQETHCQVLLTALFRRHHRQRSVDPALLHMARSKNKKMKKRLKDLLRAGKCFRKRKTIEQDIEILMGLIDMKVVSRVLKMSNITQEQLHWCEEKMGRVRVSQGKLYRDSSPLFLPPRNMLL
ncbi:hypothetical protein Dimus_027089 [Dionaea muscipula]